VPGDSHGSHGSHGVAPGAPAPPAPGHGNGGGSSAGKPGDPAATPAPEHKDKGIPAVLGLGKQVAVSGVDIPVWIPLLALFLLLAAPMAASRVANRRR
jgi:hypothetical protein